MLKNKVAIVTGASRGIGRAIAETFVREGAIVVICGRKSETLDQTARELGPAAAPVVCHVGRSEQIKAMVDMVAREFRRIDILVNNAGTNVAQAPCLDIDEGMFDKMIEITSRRFPA